MIRENLVKPALRSSFMITGFVLTTDQLVANTLNSTIEGQPAESWTRLFNPGLPRSLTPAASKAPDLGQFRAFKGQKIPAIPAPRVE